MTYYFHNQHRVPASRRAFALIELLTVMSIITLLAAILFPVFNRVRDTARKSSCQSNLRQLGMAVQLYTQDYDDRYMCGTAGFGAHSGMGWAGQILPYVKDTRILTCPSDTTKTAAANRTTLSYVYNYSMTRTSQTANEGDIQSLATLSDPSRTVLMSEARELSVVVVPGETASPTTNLAESYDINFFTVTGPIPGAPTSDSCAPARRCQWDDVPRHLGGANYLIADGHVKWYPPAAVSSGRPARTPQTAEIRLYRFDKGAEGTAVNAHAVTMSPM